MLHNISRSLEDLLGKSYMEHIQETAEVLHGMNHNAAKCHNGIAPSVTTKMRQVSQRS